MNTKSTEPEQQGLFDCDMEPRPLSHPLRDYHHAMSSGPLNYTWEDKPHRLVYDLIAAVKYYGHLAQPAPEPEPEPVRFWGNGNGGRVMRGSLEHAGKLADALDECAKGLRGTAYSTTVETMQASARMIRAQAAREPEQQEPVASIKETLAGPRLYVRGILVQSWLGCTHDENVRSLVAQINAAGSPAREPDFKEFKAWAEAEGCDTAHTNDGIKWICLNPMTADLWKAWQAAHGIKGEK